MSQRKSEICNKFKKGFVFKIDGTKKDLVTRQESMAEQLETEHGREVESKIECSQTDNLNSTF